MHKDFAIGIIVATLLLCLIILFCAILIKLYIQKIKNYTKLIYEADLNHQKILTSTIIETQEQVLDNISRDLHDDAGQQLTFINFQLENLKLDSPEMASVLQPISDSVRNLSESIRSISHSLNNQLLNQRDLIAAIEAEILRLSKNSTFRIRKSITDGQRNFTPDEKIVIYRIFQETISNIMKHAQPSEISIFITSAPAFKMEISDDGKGFTANANSESIGLMNMTRRAEIIGYHFEIRSSDGSGTTVILSEKQ